MNQEIYKLKKETKTTFKNTILLDDFVNQEWNIKANEKSNNLEIEINKLNFETKKNAYSKIKDFSFRVSEPLNSILLSMPSNQKGNFSILNQNEIYDKWKNIKTNLINEYESDVEITNILNNIEFEFINSKQSIETDGFYFLICIAHYILYFKDIEDLNLHIKSSIFIDEYYNLKVEYAEHNKGTNIFNLSLTANSNKYSSTLEKKYVEIFNPFINEKFNFYISIKISFEMDMSSLKILKITANIEEIFTENFKNSTHYSISI